MTQKRDYIWDTRKKRWVMSKEFELRANRKMKEKAIMRLQKEIDEIDRVLQALSKEYR